MKHVTRVLVGLSGLGLLAGCYASERIGTDIANVSHDVNQGGIYMHKGALSVYRPERHPETTPQLTNASLPAPATTATPPTDTSTPTPMPTPEWQPPADGSEALPKKEKEPATPPAATPPAAPAPAADAGAVFSM